MKPLSGEKLEKELLRLGG
ncbi:hypothetical protein CL3_25650 [butyrate-producing bacterium SM4/1]|nr:hypothetical protein CL3_25650 [butyrate-producing bacterium SM4/1]